MNVDRVDYVYRLQEFIIPPGVPEALQALKQAGYLLIVITNQSGIAKGIYERKDVYMIHEAIQQGTGVVLDDYYHLIHRRFSNPKIGDTIPRLAFDGSNRQPKFIVPVARDRLKAGGSIDSLAFESALWCRHCFGKTETGKDIIAGDPIWPRLTELAAMAKTDPLAWLSMEDVYGDVGQSDVFRKAFAKSLSDIWSRGTATALASFVGA